MLFLTGPVLKAQYTATTEEGRATFAMDPVIERAIDLARERGCRFFDFGTATLDEGRSLNQDLYQFKVSFGAGGSLTIIMSLISAEVYDETRGRA